MKRRIQSWRESFADLGQAILSLIQTELEALGHDISATGKRAGIGVALLGAAAAFGFWTLGVLTYASVQLLALVLPLWGAALIVTGVFALTAAILAAVGLSRLKTLRSPITQARDRFDDHMHWWQRRILTQPTKSTETQAGSGAEEAAPIGAPDWGAEDPDADHSDDSPETLQ